MRGDWRETLEELAASRRGGPTPEAIDAFAEGDVPGLKAVLLRCLAAEPAERPATAGEVAIELELCLRPATRALVRPAPGGWRDWVRRRPLLSIYAPAIGINLLASIFNIAYNEAEIIPRWSNPEAADSAFHSIVPVVNGILFPYAMFLIAIAVRPVQRAMKQLRAGIFVAPVELARRRQRALRLGAITAAVSTGCWLLAGIIWPSTLRAMVGPPGDGLSIYTHFVLSLAICGLIAAAYPYFLVTFLAVRVFYPSLLGPTGPSPSDRLALARVERDLARYRAAASGVPLLAVALLASQGASSLLPLAVLGLTGMAGVLLAFVIEGQTRAALAALGDYPVSAA